MAQKRRNPALDYLVYVLVRLAVAALQTMPIRAGYKVAWCLACIAYRVDRRHRQVAEENLRLAFGDQCDEAARQRMAFAVYEHFARVLVEIAVIPRRINLRNWKRYAVLEHGARAVRCLLEDRPTLLVTGHFGNWEMAGYLLAAIGVRGFAIARDLDNPYLQRFLLRFRQHTGQTILSKAGDLDRIQEVLENRGVLISVGDQSAGPRGYFVDFFGRPASTHKAIAILAIKHRARIIIGYGFRDRDDFHYTVGCSRVLDPLDYGDGPDAALRLTQDFTTLLEEVIRRAPEQYLWLHHRWKHEPPTKGIRRPAAA